MSDFEFEVFERRRLARQAKYKKNGSKSKKCPLSTDGMTERQWKERNGPVMTYNLGKPMKWLEFKQMPIDRQKEYLHKLISTYHVNSTNLGDMFGVQSSTVRKYLAREEINIIFKAGNYMTIEQRKVWEDFLNENEPNINTMPTPEPEETVVAPVEETVVVPKERPEKTSMDEFAVTFSGNISIDMVSNSLKYVLGNNVAGTIKILYSNP